MRYRSAMIDNGGFSPPNPSLGILSPDPVFVWMGLKPLGLRCCEANTKPGFPEHNDDGQYGTICAACFVSKRREERKP